MQTINIESINPIDTDNNKHSSNFEYDKEREIPRKLFETCEFWLAQARYDGNESSISGRNVACARVKGSLL